MPDTITCAECGTRAMQLVTARYRAEIRHDGRAYPIDLPALSYYVCPTCPGSMVLPDEADRFVGAELRRVAGLLTPEQIRERRLARGTSQRELADALSIGEATLSRWETGAQIQQRAFDKLLRLYFDVPEARDYLSGAHRPPPPPRAPAREALAPA